MNKKAIFKVGTFAVLLSFAALFFINGINLINTEMMTYDAAYNASVAANVARHSFYGVSYPKYLPFYNLITTGQTMILPTALLYKLFGISNLTSGLIPLIYGTISIFITYLLLRKSISSKCSGFSFLTAIAVILIYLSDPFVRILSVSLLGEIGSIMLLAAAFSFILGYLNSEKSIYMLLAGGFTAAAFLTKTATIFFVVSITGMLIIEALLTKRIKFKGVLMFVAGFIAGIALLDLYKLMQLGGIDRYIKWWKDEWSNMLSQSSGMDISYGIAQKIDYLPEIFGVNKICCIVLTLLPVILYAVNTLRAMLKRKYSSNGMLVMLIAGTAAASLIVYFILFGGKGLVYARRHAVNEYFLRVFAFFIILILTENAVWLLAKSKKSGAVEASVNVSTASNTSGTSKRKLNQRGLAYILAAAAILLFMCSAPFIRIKDNALKYFVRQDKTYALDLTEEFLAEVDAIPEDAQIYTFGWWQEPNVTVFLDRDMEDIEDNMYMGKKPEDGSYFITGQAVNNFSLGLIERVLGIRLIRVDQTEVDYSRYTTPFDRADMEYFAIYKIEK